MTATFVPVTQGVHQDLPEEQYFASRALSQSGAKLILDCPARFKHRLDNPGPAKRHFDVGHAAHRLILGVGAEIVSVEADNWTTKAAKAQRDEAYAAGQVPLLAKEVAQVKAMSEALLAHPEARKLMVEGRPELSMFWTDRVSGVNLRARLDWLSTATDRAVITDYKTTVSASPAAFQRALVNYGYHMQGDWYREAVRQCGVDPDPKFVFMAQEKVEPYLVSIFEPDPDVILAGREKNRQAITTFARCIATDEWPGYSVGVEPISLPSWYGWGVTVDDTASDDSAPF